MKWVSWRTEETASARTRQRVNRDLRKNGKKKIWSAHILCPHIFSGRMEQAREGRSGMRGGGWEEEGEEVKRERIRRVIFRSGQWESLLHSKFVVSIVPIWLWCHTPTCTLLMNNLPSAHSLSHSFFTYSFCPLYLFHLSLFLSQSLRLSLCPHLFLTLSFPSLFFPLLMEKWSRVCGYECWISR